MSGTIASSVWCSEKLALNWSKLPLRLGFSVEFQSVEQRRRQWLIYARSHNIDPDLAEKLISHDQSGMVVTRATAIDVDVNRDFVQQYDSSGSWWITMRVVANSGLEHVGSEARVEFRRDLSDLALMILEESFVVSSGGHAYDRRNVNYFVCPLELTLLWPAKILDPEMKCKLVPLSEQATCSPSEEFFVGRIRKMYGELIIRSGPAFDATTWKDAGFLVLETRGIFPPLGLRDQIIKKIFENGGKRMVI